MSKDNMSDQKVEYYSLNAKLCRLVQANPCMYDRSCPNYLKKEFVERAWANIAKEVNDSVGSCKERWRNIRTAFARSVNIYKTPTGPNRHKRYYLHDELQFLTKHIAQGLPSLPIRVLSPTELEENHESSRTSADEIDENCTYQLSFDNNSPANMPADEEPTPTSEPECADETAANTPTKRRKLANAEEVLTEFLNAQRGRDPDWDFLSSLLPEMRSMNARQKIVFKAKIFGVLEEVYADAKDFPRKIEPRVEVNSPAQQPPKKRKNVTPPGPNQTPQDGQSAASAQPMVVMASTPEVTVKQEPITLD